MIRACARDPRTPTSSHQAGLGVCEASAALGDGSSSAQELTLACLERIAGRDGRHSAWLRVDEDSAIAAARAADDRRAAGAAGPLTGIPVGLKDAIGVKGRPRTADSAMLDGNIAEADATAWARMDAAGMVLLGHLHCGVFANGTWGVNPWGDEFSPGGSSSGSGVALATVECGGPQPPFRPVRSPLEGIMPR
jgi:aspartyl-tRNA(Asn)/glutamyl-tRNA(Gln) amidotransferase subunit A